MARLPSGTVTLLFTDIEGSTRLLMELGEERYASVLAEHRALVRRALAAHDGHEVDTEGDSFFAAFASPADAVAAAAEVQRALERSRVRVRIGAHTGEPLLAPPNYVGLDVHRAARIMAAAHGGQVLLSQATRDRLSPETEVRDLGEHRLKDLAEPVWLFQLGQDDFPPVRSISVTNLPTRISSFVGRRRELAHAARLLARLDTRLLTLTGPGGVGKTSLAVELCRGLLDEYSNGVFFVECAPFREASLLLPEIARQLGLRAADRPLLDELSERLSGRRTLLVIDNLEHLQPEAAAELAALMRVADRLEVVATSREPLRIAGEVEYELPSLSGEEAEVLFLERAAAVGASFAADATVSRIVSRLDGLPLALELAAARAKVLAPEQLLSRLEKRLDLLRRSRDDADRHGTIRATIDWSYDLLDEETRGRFVRLSVFAGGCTLEAAELVCDADLETLASLVDKSLVRRAEDGEGGYRFWMLETIREFAAELLAASPEEEDVRRRHAAALAELAEKGSPAPTGDLASLPWARRLETELDNLRAALDWAASSGEDELLSRLVASSWPIWYSVGSVREGMDWIERTLRRTGAGERRFVMLDGLIGFAYLAGDYARSVALGEEELQLARAAGDVRRTIHALDGMALSTAMLEDHGRARALLEEALRLARERECEPNLLYQLTTNLSGLALARRDWAEVIAYGNEAISIWARLRPGHLAVVPLFNKGFALLEQGRPLEARPLFEESLIGAAKPPRLLGNVAYGLSGLAAVAAETGEPERAALLAGAADSVGESLGMTFDPTEAERHERTLASARAALGPRFAEIYQAGRTVDADSALDVALLAAETQHQRSS